MLTGYFPYIQIFRYIRHRAPTGGSLTGCTFRVYSTGEYTQ